MQHNISTTIVELDPVVYSAAKRFFALPEPEPGRLFLEDAWAFLRKQQVTDDRELYDIVVHDVFSGGSLPASLFTQQFWNHTKRVMSPDGVLAVVRITLLRSVALLSPILVCRILPVI